MTLFWITLLVVVLLPLGAFAYAGLQYLTRGTPLARVRVLNGKDGAATAVIADPDFRRDIELHVNTSLQPGNQVEMLLNGKVFPHLWEDLARARELITWHVYWFRPGKLADRMGEALAGRARAGVRVLFLYDYFGCAVEGGYLDELRAAGVEVCCFRPPRWRNLYKFQQRSHVRAVVIDGRVGYTGGFGIDDLWQGEGRREGEWRDTSVRVEGPAVLQLQTAFASNWAEARRELLVGEKPFPHAGVEGRGPRIAGLVHTAPTLGSTDAERLFALTIVGARRSLYITSAYFVPDNDFRRFLQDAAGRGVDVRVLTPGVNTDRASTWYAARAHYEELLAGGVRLYEYRPTMMHAKTVVADGVWTMVGSMNFDNRSLALNDEVMLMIHDREIGTFAEEVFRQDLEYASELELESFRRRGRWGRAKESAAVLASRVL
ncbi:MAG: phospholipase D-like domain-containing protein [Longimicrobiaceae bacterium]